MTDRALLRTIVTPRHRAATEEELALFEATCARTGLDPLARQVYAQFRTDSRTQQESMAIQATIDGFRVVAERSGDYLGGDAPQWCGPDGVWRDVWLDGQPSAARITVHKSVGGQVGDTTVVAHWREYAPTGNAGQMWAKMPALMLAKVAEALALRRAFPMVLSGIYTSDEMAQSAPASDNFLAEPIHRPPMPEHITAPEAVEALKAAAKGAGFNWGHVKECYARAGLTPPRAFADAFTGLDPDQAQALLAALKDRAIELQTDVPYTAAEVDAPPAPDTSDLPWTDETAASSPAEATEPAPSGSGDLVDGQPAGSSEDDAPTEPTLLPEGEAPVDAALSAHVRLASDPGSLCSLDFIELLSEEDFRLLDRLAEGKTARQIAESGDLNVEEVRKQVGEIKGALCQSKLEPIVLLRRSMQVEEQAGA